MDNRDISRLKKQVEDFSEQLDLLIRSGAVNKENDFSNNSELFSKISGFLGLSSDLEKDAVLKTLLKCAKKVVNAGGAALTLYNEKTNKLVFVAETGDGSGFIGYEVPLENSVHGLAFVTGEVQSSTPIHKNVESQAKATFKNVLVAPLFVNGEGIGTMSAVNKQNGVNFNSKDMEAYQYFADLAAIIIRQKVKEQMLKNLVLGKDAEIPESLKDLQFSKSDLLVMDIIRELTDISRNNEKVLENFRSVLKLFR